MKLCTHGLLEFWLTSLTSCDRLPKVLNCVVPSLGLDVAVLDSLLVGLSGDCCCGGCSSGCWIVRVDPLPIQARGECAREAIHSPPAPPG